MYSLCKPVSKVDDIHGVEYLLTSASWEEVENLYDKSRHEDAAWMEKLELNVENTIHIGNISNDKTSNNNIKKIKCDICSIFVSAYSHLKRHQRIHSGEKPYKCKECNKSFTRLDSFKTHSKVHIGEKPYKCEQCSKGFARLDRLKLHLEGHNVKKPHNMCGKYPTPFDSVKIHSLVHESEKNKCPTCNKCLSSKSSLTRHQRIHNGEKPYNCENCGKCFSQSTSLKKHSVQCVKSSDDKSSDDESSDDEMYHEKCHICGEYFLCESALKVHLKVHSGKKYITCAFCGKEFSSSGLNKHMRVNHATVDSHV